jgi:hypothetical protein
MTEANEVARHLLAAEYAKELMDGDNRPRLIRELPLDSLSALQLAALRAIEAALTRPAGDGWKPDREAVAQVVHDAMRWAADRSCVDKHPEWQGGNSFAEDEARRAADRIAALSAEAEGWRHVKRGTVYEVLGRAIVQDAYGVGVCEDAQVVIYRGEDGKIWAREEVEFRDGRFEPLPAAPSSNNGESE